MTKEEEIVIAECVVLFLTLVSAVVFESVWLAILAVYISIHVLCGPLDWYLIYKALKKLREVI